MHERRWESESEVPFDEVVSLRNRLKGRGLAVKGIDQEIACYLEEFRIDHLSEIDRLSPWMIEEMTLVQINDRWEGDFFVLAGEHHDLYRSNPCTESYLSLSHPWRIPAGRGLKMHQQEAMFWIGFRDTHGFIRVRIAPREIITPWERRGEGERMTWVGERVSAFSEAIDLLELPLLVRLGKGSFTILSTDSSSVVSSSWPDAFGPCQFEYVVLDRYELLVPAARLVSKTGTRPGLVRTFLSGFPRDVLEQFHRLQPQSTMLYRGYIRGVLEDLPEIVRSIQPHGRALVNICEFATREIAPGEEAHAVVGIIGSRSGFGIEVRLNRAPLPEEAMGAWLNELIGLPMRYSPLVLY